jgi:hypothetical protein
MHAVLDWMNRYNVFSGLASALVASVVLPIVWWGINRLQAWLERSSHRICFDVPGRLADRQFYLRHVRNGVGSAQPGERLYMADIPFPTPPTGAKRCVPLKVPQRMGAQFKVYMANDDALAYEAVRAVLESAGYSDISLDPDPLNPRVWFLLPDYPRIKDGPITNNFCADRTEAK